MPFYLSFTLAVAFIGLVATSFGQTIDFGDIPRDVQGAISNPLAPGLYALDGANFHGNESWVITYSKDFNMAVWKELSPTTGDAGGASNTTLEERQNNSNYKFSWDVGSKKPGQSAPWCNSASRVLPENSCHQTDHIPELQSINAALRDRYLTAWDHVPDLPGRPRNMGILQLYTGRQCTGRLATQVSVQDWETCFNISAMKDRVFSVLHKRV